MVEAAVQSEALWTKFSSCNSTKLIPKRIAAEAIDRTHSRFTTLILAARRRVRKAAILRDELAIVVTKHAIRWIALFRPLDNTITTHLARTPSGKKHD